MSTVIEGFAMKTLTSGQMAQFFNDIKKLAEGYIKDEVRDQFLKEIREEYKSSLLYDICIGNPDLHSKYPFIPDQWEARKRIRDYLRLANKNRMISHIKALNHIYSGDDSKLQNMIDTASKVDNKKFKDKTIMSVASDFIITEWNISDAKLHHQWGDLFLDCSLSLHPIRGKILILPFGLFISRLFDKIANKKLMKELTKEEKEFVEKYDIISYPYWNNTDRPDDVSDREWDKRRREWSCVDVPATSGFLLDFTHDRINNEMVLYSFVNDKEFIKECEESIDLKNMISLKDIEFRYIDYRMRDEKFDSMSDYLDCVEEIKLDIKNHPTSIQSEIKEVYKILHQEEEKRGFQNNFSDLLCNYFAGTN